MTFNKSISKLGLLFAAVGGIIGSGWLLGPFYTAQVAGPAAVLSWVIGGCLMMMIALTFAELATMFPIAGGVVRFTHFSHGKFASFTLAWISWLAAVMVAPIESMAAIQYASNYLPELVNRHPGSVELSALGISVAAAVMLIMCIINMFSVRYFSKSNNVIVIWKILIPIITVLILFSHHFNVATFTQYGGFAPYGLQGILSALPTAGVIFSFIGYSPAIQLAEEAKNPSKAIPFAIIGALLIAIVIYVAVETSFIGALDPKAVAKGWKYLNFSGDAGPMAGILMSLGVVWFLKLIYIDAFVSPLGTAYIYTASTARVNYGMSKNGYVPQFMQDLNSHRSPWKAIITNYIVGMIFFAPFPGWQQMVSFLVSCFVIAYAIGPISCATLRKTMPDTVRPFRVPCYKLFCFVAFYICNLIVYWTGWDIISKMLLTIGLGYVYLIVHHFVARTKEDFEIRRGSWLFPYLIGMGILSYLGSFGHGLNLLPFGADFAVIAVFSAVIYVFATRK